MSTQDPRPQDPGLGTPGPRDPGPKTQDPKTWDPGTLNFFTELQNKTLKVRNRLQVNVITQRTLSYILCIILLYIIYFICYILYIVSGGNGEELNKCSPPFPAILL